MLSSSCLCMCSGNDKNRAAPLKRYHFCFTSNIHSNHGLATCCIEHNLNDLYTEQKQNSIFDLTDAESSYSKLNNIIIDIIYN